MTTGISLFVRAAIVAAIVLLAPPARAGFLGHSLELLSVTNIDTETSLSVFVAGPQLEYHQYLDFFDIADISITLGNKPRNCSDATCPSATPFFQTEAFIGYKLVDYVDTIFPIIHVELASSTVAGFTASQIEFSENEIFVRFNHPLGYLPGNVIPPGEIVLNVRFMAASEPGTLALFCTALAGVFRAGRRRKIGCPTPS